MGKRHYRKSLPASLAIVLCAGAAPALGQTAVFEVVNDTGLVLQYRAGSGFQGRLETPPPARIAPGDTTRISVEAGYPKSQGGGFRYGDGAGRECDFGALRLFHPGSGWGHPTTRASPRGDIRCRATIIVIDNGGDFTIRFFVE
jgi:hypothetical protein